MLTLDDLLSIDDKLVVKIAVPEWGRDVWLARPSAERKDALDRRLYDADNKETDTRNWRARTVALCLANEEGVFLCDDPMTAGDRLASKSAAAIERLFGEAKKLAGMETEEELEKN